MKKLFRYGSITLILLVSLVCLIFPIYGTEISQQEAIIRQITNDRVTATKILYDFDGNAYTLYETGNLGYYIFHNQTNQIMEFNQNSISPYYGKTENLYYVGPGNYLTKSFERSVNCYISISDGAEIQSEEYNRLVDLSKKIESNVQKEAVDKNDDVPATRATPAGAHYVSHAEVFTTTGDNTGYLEEDKKGLCGYIALALLVNYNYVSQSSCWIQNSNYHTVIDGISYPTPELTKELRRIGKDDFNYKDTGTVASQIKTVGEKYASNFGVKTGSTWNTIFFLWKDIYNLIEENHPILMFGSIKGDFPSPSHAVTCYGTYDFGGGNKGYIVHYGWKPDETYDYSHVSISSSIAGAVWGSICSLWTI